MVLSKKEKILLFTLLIFILILFIVLILKDKILSEEKLVIETDKKEYGFSDLLRIKIKNNLETRVCFSSCYPYLLEKKNSQDRWRTYFYEKCGKDDISNVCIESGETKVFELLSEREGGLHRIALFACLSCGAGEYFKKEATFYSNEFIISEGK